MVDVTIYDKEGNESEQIEVDQDLFGDQVNVPLLHQAITTYEANQRTGSASTKKRSETAYSNAKPWPQKNTGRARHGERGSPIWVGGGISFGPRPRDYSKDLPDQMKDRALDSALLSKLIDDQLVLVEAFDIPQPKTKIAKERLEDLDLTESSVLILTEEYEKKKFLAVRNLQDVGLKPISQTNAREVLKYEQILIERDAFRSFMESRAEELHGIEVENE